MQKERRIVTSPAKNEAAVPAQAITPDSARRAAERVGAWTVAPKVDGGLLALRLFAGLSLALGHGIGKLPPSDGFVAGVAGMGFAPPLLFAWAAGLAESLGGILLAIGLFTRPAALFVLVNMAVASFVMQAGDPFLERELALLYSAVAALYLLAGAGRYSLDGLRERRGAHGAAPPGSRGGRRPVV